MLYVCFAKNAEHGAMGETAAQPMFWPSWTKRSKLKMNFHFVSFLHTRSERVVIVADRARGEKGWKLSHRGIPFARRGKRYTLGGSWTRSLP